MLADAACMSRLVLTLLLILTCGPAWPGAWLREKGTAFTAASLTAFREADGAHDYKTSLYSEWGARPHLTLGLDAEEHRDLYGHALLFARFPLADFGKSGRFAAEVGAGAHHRGLQAWAMYKAALSYGRGIQTGWGGGWIAIDTALEYRTHEALIRKLDFTAGLSSGRRFDPLLQIETSYTPGTPWYWSARPSVMYRPKSGKTTWVLGFERNAARDGTGVKLALWSTY